MTRNRLSAALTASTLALSLALAPAVSAKPKKQQQKQAQQEQTLSGGTAGGITGQGVSVSTSGEGYTTTSPDGWSAGVSGTADAEAVDGIATTRSSGRVTEDRAMQRSAATARTDEERARSRTQTMVRPGDVVRSRTTTHYKERGEKPVRETVTTIVTPEGTTTRTKDNGPK